MRRLLLLTLLTPVFGLTGSASDASAAPPGCAEPKSLSKESATASLVFAGEVRGSEKQGGEFAYEVKVTRVYRGEGLLKRVTVSTPATKSDCGVRGIEKGQSWMFMSDSTAEPVVTLSSDGTTEATGKVVREVEAALGPGEKPTAEPEPAPTAALTPVADDDPETFWPMSLPGFILVGVGLVVLAAARGLSRRADRHT